MDVVEKFLVAPTNVLFESLTKDNIRKVAEYYNIEIILGKSCKLQELRDFVRPRLIER